MDCKNNSKEQFLGYVLSCSENLMSPGSGSGGWKITGEDVNGEKQNETGYELSRETFVATQSDGWTRLSRKWLGDDADKRLNVSQHVCLTSPCILSSFLRRHGIKKPWTDKEGNISHQSSSTNPIVCYFYPIPPFFSRKRDHITTTVVVSTYGWIVGWSIRGQRENRAMNWKKKKKFGLNFRKWR